MKLKIKNTKISNKFKKKICLIADIHFYYDTNPAIFDLIINNIKRNKPDYICISGDITDRKEIVEDPIMNILYSFLNDLGNLAQVYIILGNHDLTANKDLLIENLKKIKNINFLEEAIIDNDISIHVYNQTKETYQKETGYENKVINELNEQLKPTKDKFNILLAHSPIYLVKDQVFNNTSLNKYNLILCGHNHDGIITFLMPKNTSLISPKKKMFLKNGRGLVKKDKTNIVITGGVTKLSNCSGKISKLNKYLRISIDYINI